MRERRAIRWSLAGAVLALGAPAGRLMLELLVHGRPADGGLLAAVIDRDPLGWGYLWGATTLVMVAAGGLLGHLTDRMAASALIDALTGLWNRRAFSRSLARELARSERGAAPLSVLLIDLDHLKRINDEGGHAAGDAALAAVGARLREISRRSDVAARIGGDEFALLAPDTPPDQALALAERLCAALRSTAGHPTVSVGVSGVVGGYRTTAEGLLARADAALYAAKAAGRDRAHLAEEGEADPRRG